MLLDEFRYAQQTIFNISSLRENGEGYRREKLPLCGRSHLRYANKNGQRTIHRLYRKVQSQDRTESTFASHRELSGHCPRIVKPYSQATQHFLTFVKASVFSNTVIASKITNMRIYPIPTLVLATIALLTSCAYETVSWTPPAYNHDTTYSNELLQNVEWLDLDGNYGPEDIAIDKQGNIYCGSHLEKTDFSTGKILKITPDGIVTTFCATDSWVAGLHFDQDGNLIACDTKRGLISISPDGELTVLSSESENAGKFLIANDVDISSDGKIYFSNTSSKYSFNQKNARKIIMQMIPDGGLYCYDPQTHLTTTIIDSSFFGNGVAVSADDSFVLMVDLAKYRIVRHWLKGERVGEIEVFMDNLPGLPNGISRREDGTFWLGFTTRRDPILDRIQPSPFLKKLITSIPLWMQPKQESFGMIMNIDTSGEVLSTLYDTSGKKVPEASSIEEYNNKLYLGGDLIDHIAIYTLPEKK